MIGYGSRSTTVVINTALYYMHRIYQIFSPDTIKPIDLAITSLYLAGKIEDFYKPLKYLVESAYYNLGRQFAPPLTTYIKVAEKIRLLEAILLIYLGFDDLEGKQPHVIVVSVYHKNKSEKVLLQCSYLICTNMLLFSDFCLRYSSEAIAAASVLVCAMWMKRDLGDPKTWLQNFGEGLEFEIIREMAIEFIAIFNAVDSAIKEKMKIMMYKHKQILHEELQARTQPEKFLQSSQEHLRSNQVQLMPHYQTRMGSENLPTNLPIVPPLPLPHLAPPPPPPRSSFPSFVPQQTSRFSHFPTIHYQATRTPFPHRLPFHSHFPMDRFPQYIPHHPRLPPPQNPYIPLFFPLPPQTSWISHSSIERFLAQPPPLLPSQVQPNAAHPAGFIGLTRSQRDTTKTCQ
ncbi:unnamed protein product [Hymenolepis diminuta]|nr:unnamed protein product [Hymenolepis diminuta]